jgi:hypothetical protein
MAGQDFQPRRWTLTTLTVIQGNETELLAANEDRVYLRIENKSLNDVVLAMTSGFTESSLLTEGWLLPPVPTLVYGLNVVEFRGLPTLTKQAFTFACPLSNAAIAVLEGFSE